ncbi:unnamed protein product [Dicrocoelium dendriticum]|nr:unnamed protein product [Dicrocoelium dendriticum]
MVRKGVRKSRYKTKHRSRDIDQIYEDVAPENVVRRITEATKPDDDLPGLGRFFCVHCAKYFINQSTLDRHKLSKPHKRRLKLLLESPHSQVDADWAAGLHRDESHMPSKKRLLASDEELSAITCNRLEATYVCAD